MAPTNYRTLRDNVRQEVSLIQGRPFSLGRRIKEVVQLQDRSGQRTLERAFSMLVMAVGGICLAVAIAVGAYSMMALRLPTMMAPSEILQMITLQSMIVWVSVCLAYCLGYSANEQKTCRHYPIKDRSLERSAFRQTLVALAIGTMVSLPGAYIFAMSYQVQWFELSPLVWSPLLALLQSGFVCGVMLFLIRLFFKQGMTFVAVAGIVAAFGSVFVFTVLGRGAAWLGELELWSPIHWPTGCMYYSVIQTGVVGAAFMGWMLSALVLLVISLGFVSASRLYRMQPQANEEQELCAQGLEGALLLLMEQATRLIGNSSSEPNSRATIDHEKSIAAAIISFQACTSAPPKKMLLEYGRLSVQRIKGAGFFAGLGLLSILGLGIWFVAICFMYGCEANGLSNYMAANGFVAVLGAVPFLFALSVHSPAFGSYLYPASSQKVFRSMLARWFFGWMLISIPYAFFCVAFWTTHQLGFFTGLSSWSDPSCWVCFFCPSRAPGLLKAASREHSIEASAWLPLGFSFLLR